MNRNTKDCTEITKNLMKEISKQCINIKNKKEYDDNKHSMSTANNQLIHDGIQRELTATALKEAFLMAAKDMRLTESSIRVGKNFIHAIINNDASLPRDKRVVNTNLITYREQGSIKSLYADLITSYTKMALAEKAEINSMTLFDTSFILEDDSSYAGKDMIDAFKSKVKEFTPKNIGKEVSNRVEKAVSSFIKSRNDKTQKIKKIYTNIKNFASNPNASKKDVDNAQEAARCKISKIKECQMGIMESMVDALATACMTNKELHNKYIIEATNSLDMDSIIDDTSAVYAVMEIANITGLIKIDDKFIKSYIDELK